MRTSFLLDNRDSTRPPLLLPSLSLLYNTNYNLPNSTTFHGNVLPTVPINTTVLTTTTTTNNNNNINGNNMTISNNPLDNLANLATNIFSTNHDSSTIIHSTDPNVASMTTSTTTTTTKKRRKTNRVVDIITPPPTKPSTPPKSININGIININHDNSSSNTMNVTERQLHPSKYYRKLAERGTSSKKRQRIGPSCDKCRIKKIKCNASIEIILKDSRIVGMFNEHLHYILTDQDIEMFNKKWSHIFGVKLPYTICNVPMSKPNSKNNDSSSSSYSTNNDASSTANKEPEYQAVIKHLDKLIIFQSCTSCNKRKYKNSESGPMSCKFARGFSRPDINQFNKIKIHMMSMASGSSSNPSIHKDMPIYDLTINDYQNAGFQLIPLQ